VTSTVPQRVACKKATRKGIIDAIAKEDKAAAVVIQPSRKTKRLKTGRGVGSHAAKLVVVEALGHCAVVDADDEAHGAAHVLDNAIPKALAPEEVGDVAVGGVDVSLRELTVGVLLCEEMEAVEEEQVLRDAAELDGCASSRYVKAVADALAAGQGRGHQPVVFVPFKRCGLGTSGPRGGANCCASLHTFWCLPCVSI
jgi:hypothetical protein